MPIPLNLRTSISLGVSLLLALPLVLASGCSRTSKASSTKPKDEAPSIPVEVTAVSRGSVRASYAGTTALEAEDDAQVVAKVGGVVKRILVEEGDVVREGQVLATLEDDQYRYELAQAEARLSTLTEDVQRARALLAENIMSTEAYQRIRSEAEAQESAADLARLRVNYASIKAPIGGVVAERLIKTGNMVTVNQPVFRVTDFDPLWAVLHVPEKELARLSVGQTAVITADALPGKELAGTVIRLSPTVAGGSGTFKATVEVRDASRSLKPGMFVRASIVHDVHADVLLVPKDAVLTEDVETSVFVVEERTGPPPSETPKGKATPTPAGTPAPFLAAAKRAVTVGYVNTTHVEILSGVKQGDRVVITGVGSLKDGARVKVVGAP